MKKRSVNLLWIIQAIFTLVLALVIIFVLALDHNRYATGTEFYVVLAFLVFFIELIRRPIWCEFDTNALTSHFILGFYERFEWRSISKIERDYFLLDVNYYKITGPSSGKGAFFTSPIIRASFKTKKLIREFWSSDF